MSATWKVATASDGEAYLTQDAPDPAITRCAWPACQSGDILEGAPSVPGRYDDDGGWMAYHPGCAEAKRRAS